MHMRETRIEKEVEICATNLANETKCMSTNAMSSQTVFHFFTLMLIHLVFLVISRRISLVSGD
jgi:hypothetical protein